MYKIDIVMMKPDGKTVQEIIATINRALSNFTGTNSVVIVKDNASLSMRDRNIKEVKTRGK